jgi:hypothetical protein
LCKREMLVDLETGTHEGDNDNQFSEMHSIRCKYSSNPSPNNEQWHTTSSLRRKYEWVQCSGNA